MVGYFSLLFLRTEVVSVFFGESPTLLDISISLCAECSVILSRLCFDKFRWYIGSLLNVYILLAVFANFVGTHLVCVSCSDGC